MNRRVRLSEWSDWVELPISTSGLSDDDEELITALAAGGESAARLDVRERAGAVSVRSRSWVGTARIAGIDIQVTPKIIDLEEGFVRLLERVGGYRSLSRVPSTRKIAAAREGGLLDLIIVLLTEETARLLREGLNLGYREMEDSLPVLRGRMLVDRQALRRFGRVDRLECRFEELDHAVLENQLLVAALAAATQLAQTDDVRRRARRIHSEVMDACGGVDPPSLEYLRMVLPPGIKRSLNRQLARYAAAIDLSWLVLDAYRVNRPLTPRGPTRSFAFFFDMNVLFERFLTRWLAEQLAPRGFRVTAQRAQFAPLYDAATSKPFGLIRPDILVSRRGVPPVAVDAKYKLYSKPDRDGGRPNPPLDDVSQALLYAYAYGGADQEMRTTLLVFPVKTSASCEPRTILLADARDGRSHIRVEAYPFPLAAALDGDSATPELQRLLDRVEELAVRPQAGQDRHPAHHSRSSAVFGAGSGSS
jgi:5-methylcytosine-specific restriction enzyme subunit McrC